MVRPWSTMVSDHGWPWSGNVLTMVEPWLTMVMLDGHHCRPWLTMVRQPWSDHVQFHIQKSNDHGQSWSNTWCADIQINTPLGDEHGRTMVNHGWPWSGNVLTMVEPWLTMVRLYQATMVRPWSTMVNHGQFVPHSKIKWPLSIMVKYLMCRHSNQHTSEGWTWPNHGQPWLTMVWQCFAHGWTMVDHGQVISGNHGLTMVNHRQFYIQKSNDLMVNHGQIPDVQTFKLICLWGMNMAKPWSTMVWQCFDHGWTMVDHGQVNSGNHGQFHIQKSNDLMVNHGLKYLMCRHSN